MTARVLRASPLSVVVGIVVALIAVGGFFLMKNNTAEQNQRLLRDQTAQGSLIASNTFDSLTSQVMGPLAASATLDPAGLQPMIASITAAGRADQLGVAVFQRFLGAYVAVAAAGPTQAPGMLAGPTLQRTLVQASSTGQSAGALSPNYVPSPVVHHGARSTVGFAQATAAGSNTIVYFQATINPFTEASQLVKSGGPFEQLRAVLYGSPQPEASHLVIATTNHDLPLSGNVASTEVPVGTSKWLLVTQPRAPLAGGFAQGAPWIILALGLVLAVLLGTTVELLVRRHRYAAHLVEERTAELADRTRDLETSLRDLREAQVKLVQGERLAALGEMASVVSHELRNPLTAVTNALFLLRVAAGTSASADMERHLEMAERETGKAAALADDLTAFVRPRQMSMQEIDLADAVHEVIEATPPPPGVDLKVHAPSTPVVADPGQLAEIITNLLTNAYEAMSGEGRVEVRADADREGVAVVIEDSGPGIDPSVAEKILEPFVTTKATGTGLGLAIVRRIVDAHGGEISLESPPAGGARVTVRLPAPPSTEGGTPSEDPATAAPAPAGGDPTVPEPAAPEPAAPAPGPADQVPVEPEPVALEPAAPEPAARGPVSQEPPAPQHVAPGARVPGPAGAASAAPGSAGGPQGESSPDKTSHGSGLEGEGPGGTPPQEHRNRDGSALLAIEDTTVRQSLTEALAASGIRSFGCGSSAEALALQADHGPAVAVVDDPLPDGSGIDLVRALKGRDRDVPVVLLTRPSSEEQAIAVAGRLDACLVKPLAVQALVQATQQALARRRLIADNRAMAERLGRLDTHHALYDPLTGLPNRVLLDDRLTHALAASRRSGGVLAVLFVDLDTFKVLNDLFGHQVGDQLLRQTASRLAGARRASDTVARFGGDEFVVVCPDVKTSATACRIAETMLAQLSTPLRLEGMEHRLSASIGVALSSRRVSHQSAETLLRNADTAMYRAKEMGRGRWELFDDTLRERVTERLEVERGLQSAVANEEFFLVYQPVVGLSSGQVVGAEALLRWRRPGYGTVLPASFLPVAEETGVIVEIDRWVLERATSDLAAANAAGYSPDPFRLWINVSPHQLAHPRFAELVSELLAGHGIAPSMFGLEVIEDVLREMRISEKVLRQLRELGVAISLDDFGGGYSNLSWLQGLPISGIKIDRRYVALLGDGERDPSAAFVRALVEFGHALGLSVVGEGVENATQAQRLRSMGCELAQGYHFAYPETPEQLFSLAQRSARTSS